MLHKTRTIYNDAGENGRPHAGYSAIIIQHCECWSLHFWRQVSPLLSYTVNLFYKVFQESAIERENYLVETTIIDGEENY